MLRFPRRFWTLGLIALTGVPVGLGVFTLSYAEATSYLSDDPETCVNCHVMREQFDGWNHSSHQAVATCNDCHTPHDFPNKWVVKGINGWNHSYAFTTGHFPDPIRIKEFNAQVVQDNCVYCHRELVSQIYKSETGEELRCVACHGNVGHSR